MSVTAAITPPTLQTIAAGADWRVSRVTCRAGPADRPYEEQHDGVTIAAVLDGSFSYRTPDGRALLLPGAVLLGNPGACFECGHAHSTGDRCVALHLAPALFAEVAGSFGRGAHERFRRVAIPPVPALLPAFAAIRRLGRTPDSLLGEQIVLEIAARVLALEQDAPEPPSRLRDEARVARVLRFMAAHYTEALTIDGLARQAGMGRRRFAAVFRQVAGVSPYAYLLAVRLDAAARALEARPPRPVLEIALDSGFGDLSEFTRRFRARFGRPPGQYRRMVGGM